MKADIWYRKELVFLLPENNYGAYWSQKGKGLFIWGLAFVTAADL